jgi:hypothetical protein
MVVYLNPNLNQIVRRGVFDLGANFTKFVLADVNISKIRIDELHYYAKTVVHYNENLAQPEKQELSYLTSKRYIDSINHYKSDAEINFNDRRNIEFYGILRYPLSKTANTRAFLDHIYGQTGVKIRTINEHQEGVIAYDSIITTVGERARNAILWDINNNNMQLISRKDGDVLVIDSSIAYESFYNLVKKEIKNTKNIYPLTKAEINQALELALDSIKLNPHSENKIKEHLKKGYKIIGRGFVHNYIVQHYVNLNEMRKRLNFINYVDISHYNVDQLKEAINLLANKNLQDVIPIMYDKEKYKYAERELTSLILTYAIMHKLGIKLVHTVNAKNIFGILLNRYD